MLAENLLPKLSDWHPSGAGRHSWSEAFPDAGWNVRVAADRADTLSCLVWEMTLTRTGEPPADLTLGAWAASLASRATGLMEPLTVHEVDGARGEAVLRSTAPAKKGEYVSYYEVRLEGRSVAVVRRYTASKTASGRTQVAYPVTHEAIAKLAADIAG